MNQIKLSAAKKVAVAIAKTKNKIKKDLEKEESKIHTNEPLEYHGESYQSIEEAEDWYGCGGITSEELEEIRAEFQKRESATTPEILVMKEMVNYYTALIDYMKGQVEELENSPKENK